MTTIVTIDMGGTGATHAAGAREALSVPSMTDMGQSYSQANSARDQANTARGNANDAYSQANTAYSQANSARGQANTAYGQANSARSDANTTFATINTTFGTVNTNYQAAYAQANNARDQANTARTQANTGYDQANTARTQANTAYGQANSAYGQANAAYGQANSAYGAANNRVLKAGDTMTGQLNISSGGLLVTGNVNIDSGVLFVDALNNRVGVGTSIPATSVDVIGSIQSNSAVFTSASQIKLKTSSANSGYGVIQRNDGSDFYFLLTANNDADGNWNGLRPFHFSVSSGSVTAGNSTLFVGHGATTGAANVGVGTTSPLEKLDVRGNVYIGGADAGPNFIAFRGTTADGPGSYNHTYIGERIWSAGTEKSELFIFKGNDHDATSGPDRIRLAAGEFRIDTYTTSISGSFETVANNASLLTRLTVVNTGNVGIATTTPTSNLHVVGNANITTGINTTTVNATTVNAATLLTTAGINVSAAALNAYGQANSARDQANTAYGQANSARGQANTAYGQANLAYAQANSARDQANTAYGQANSAYGAANNRVLKAGDTMTGQLNISSGGLLVTGNSNFDGGTLFINSVNDKVGIGITTPWSTLWIERAGIDVANLTFEDATSNAHLTLAGSDAHVRLHFGTMNVAPYGGYIQSSYDNTPDNSGSGSSGLEPLLINPLGGDVGIGTALASFTSGSGLEIQRSTATATLRLDSSTFATELYGYTDGTGLFQLSAGYLDLGTNNTTRLRIDANGNVGIGTTSPGSKLDIGTGDIRANGGLYFLDSSTYGNYVRANNYPSKGYSAADNRFWIEMGAKGGVHVVINTDGGADAAENDSDDFAVFQGARDSSDTLFRVKNSGKVYAKHSYYVGNTHNTAQQSEFGTSAINTVATAGTNVNTLVESYENRSGVYWLNFNGQIFRAFIKTNWLQGRNWVLAAKFFDAQDMPSGSSLWTNDTFVNEGDFDIYSGKFSKYKAWRYFSFDRLAMQMANRIAPIMRFSSNQTLFGAFSGGRAVNGGGVTAVETYPQIANSATYHGITNFVGTNFSDIGGAEDIMQSYGLNKWANSSTNSTSGNNEGSRSYNSGTLRGYELTLEDSHPNLTGVDSTGVAGAWIGCPMDEGGFTFGSASSSSGADSGFGFGFGCGNNPRTGTSGYAEWGRGNECVNLLPGYIWLSID